MSINEQDGTAGPKPMSRDLFFPTPIYFTDLADTDALNYELKSRIYAWRDADPDGTFRTNVPQVGGWHSATDMHTRREFNRLTLEIFEFVQGVFDHLGYSPDHEPACDSMWANINPRYAYNRHHSHPHALWSGVYYVQTPPNSGLSTSPTRGPRRRSSRRITTRSAARRKPGTRSPTSPGRGASSFSRDGSSTPCSRTSPRSRAGPAIASVSASISISSAAPMLPTVHHVEKSCAAICSTETGLRRAISVCRQNPEQPQWSAPADSGMTAVSRPGRARR